MKSVNLLIKPASSLCNLRCRYCFYEDEARNRTQRSMGVMSQALAQQLICQAFDAVDAGGAVNFTFQGGEPTVAGLPFFRDFAQTVRTHCPAGVSVHYAIQTNGTLLDEQWAAFLKQEHFLVGLSLDGMRRVHDSLRLDAAGSGTWQRVLAAKSLLEKYGVDYNALCVVTADCARRGEQVYKNLKNLGFRYIQFIACMDPIGRPRGQEPWSLTPEEYGVFLCRIFDLWYQDWKKRDYHSIRLFDDYIHILLGDGASTCATCGKTESEVIPVLTEPSQPTTPSDPAIPVPVEHPEGTPAEPSAPSEPADEPTVPQPPQTGSHSWIFVSLAAVAAGAAAFFVLRKKSLKD